MNTTIELGAYVRTDRFCTVTIDAIFADNEDAVKCGYTEPTYTRIDGWEIKALKSLVSLSLIQNTRKSLNLLRDRYTPIRTAYATCVQALNITIITSTQDRLNLYQAQAGI